MAPNTLSATMLPASETTFIQSAMRTIEYSHVQSVIFARLPIEHSRKRAQRDGDVARVLRVAAIARRRCGRLLVEDDVAVSLHRLVENVVRAADRREEKGLVAQIRP